MQVAKAVYAVVPLLPEAEFGLRISDRSIGDVSIRKSGYDPVRKIARNRILRL